MHFFLFSLYFSDCLEALHCSSFQAKASASDFTLEYIFSMILADSLDSETNLQTLLCRALTLFKGCRFLKLTKAHKAKSKP